MSTSPSSLSSRLSDANKSANRRVAKRDYLRFVVANEDFAIPLRDVVEIVNYGAMTTVPGCAPWIRGLFNLRGQVLPVSDLALRIGIASQPVTRKTVLVVLRVSTPPDSLELALVADMVREVVAIEDEAIESVPAFGLHLNVDYLNGLIRHGELFLKSVNLQTLVGYVPSQASTNVSAVDETAKRLGSTPAVAPTPPLSEVVQVLSEQNVGEGHDQSLLNQDEGASEEMPGLFLFDDTEIAA